MTFKKTTYSRRLADPRWQKRRLEIFNRDKFTCQHCGATDLERLKSLITHLQEKKVQDRRQRQAGPNSNTL